MSIKECHPEYVEYSPLWKIMRDLYAGEEHIKNEGETYLPITSGMRIDGMGYEEEGYKSYQSYKLRAILPDYIKEGIEMLSGIMHQKPPIIELPSEMEYLRDNATINNESLNDLLRRINIEQLLIGRVGLLVDTNENPYIALYSAESIINWDDNFVILDESSYLRDGFSWEYKEKYRPLILLDGEYKTNIFEEEYDESEMLAPLYHGASLSFIPFIFINSRNNLSNISFPPLQGLANLTLAIYRQEADYRQNLFMQSQDTLVVVGGIKSTLGDMTNTLRTGAGARIDLDITGDAKYIGVNSNGLAEQRLSIENDRKRAALKAGELIQSKASQQESGAALTTRFTAQTATLNHIALTGAQGLQLSLRQIAKWMELDPMSCSILPNMEFVTYGLDGQNFYQLITARAQGLPISLQSLHANMADRGLTTLDFQKEMSIIAQENKKFENFLDSSNLPELPNLPNPMNASAQGQAQPTPESRKT